MDLATEANLQAALDAVEIELRIAIENFPPMRSAHEGVAIIDEEMREFRDAAYWPHKGGDEEEEATQLAAMAVRYLIDVCYNEDTPR